jgi:hypothetical protein
MKVELLSPNNEPVLYAHQGFTGSASFINPVDIIYTPIPGSTTPLPLLGYGAGVQGWGNWNGFNGNYFNGYYGAGNGWGNDFNSINAN